MLAMLGRAPRQLRPISTLARPSLPPGMNTAVVATIGEGLAWFAAERDRWILWIPVLMGFGVAIYFGLPGEPPAWVGPSLAIGAAVSILVLLGRAADRSIWLRPAGAGVLAMIAGFAAAQAKAVAVGTEMLSGRTRADAGNRARRTRREFPGWPAIDPASSNGCRTVRK